MKSNEYSSNIMYKYSTKNIKLQVTKIQKKLRYVKKIRYVCGNIVYNYYYI